MVRSACHRLLAPSFLGALGRHLEAVVESRVISPDAFQQVRNIRGHALQRLSRYGAELQQQLGLLAMQAAMVLLVVMLLVESIEGVSRKAWQVRVRDEIHPTSFRNGIEAWPDAANDLAKLLDRIPVQGLWFGAVAEEHLRSLYPDAHHHDADADIGDGFVGMLHVDAQIRLHATTQQRPGAGTAELVCDHRTQQHVAFEPRA